MSPLAIALLLSLLSSIRFLFFTFFRTRGQRLPPGPRPMPIIGNLHLLATGNLPHQTLSNLAKKHGPIMSIKLGSVRTILVSSPKAAELFLKTHDSVFASRPKLQISEIMSYGTKAMGFTEYGPYWRNVRRLCVSQLLSASKVEFFRPLRTQEVESTVKMVKESAEKGKVMNVSRTLAEMFENLMCKMIVGRGMNDDDGELKLKENIQELGALAGAFNISDLLPFLAPFDLQGLTRRMRDLSKSLDKTLEKIIKEHEQDNLKNKEHGDFVDVLLSLLNKPVNPQDQNSEIISRTHIKAILLDMIAAATDTSATAIDWTFSEILKNPRVMRTLQDELETVVGKNRMVQESDLQNLTYLDMVIKEGLRLHPVAPLLVPHESMEDVTVDGFYIPRKSRVLVNVWAIGRDFDVWSDNAEEFFPERFANNDIDVQGHDFSLLPFGSGRRRCPGMHMGLINMRIVLGQFLHCFDWKLPSEMAHGDLDMAEKFGLSVARANNVFAKPIYRLNC